MEKMAENKDVNKEEKIELPPVEFTTFIGNLASTAFVYMGGIQDPETKKPIVQLDIAKHQIDIIEMLQENTKGNLTSPEKNFLENTLYNLRMSYVRMANRPPTEEESTETEE